MEKKDTKSCSFARAQQIILSHIGQLPGEVVVLQEALQRIALNDIAAAIPQPSFDESTRDGYVVALQAASEGESDRYEIVGEIPAGNPYKKRLAPGTACRIMTGGCIPLGGIRVIPSEDCITQNGEVIVTLPPLQPTRTFIKKAGSEIAPGDGLVAAGLKLQTGHLALLSACGIHAVEVTTKPCVGFVCTGSELTTRTEDLENGQKYSSNAFLLHGLLSSIGAHHVNIGTIEDNDQELVALFTKVTTDERLDALITTGGMGPGKYDLVERAFVKAGGKVVFNAISMRPGKSFLFGILGRTLVFGLPGPPHAVRTLLNELVGPPLLTMQGEEGLWPRKVKAYLQHHIEVKRNDVLRFKDGVLTMEEGRCLVRFAGRLETGNCFLLLPPGQVDYGEGELVEVHLALDLSSIW